MSKTQAIMKFESLPNEMLVECFEYLDAIDIFHAFDFLNKRFYDLIRNIRLKLDIEHVNQSALVEFGIKILLNPQITQQIQSLKLLKSKIDNTKTTLLSFLSFNELTQLRSLVLIDLYYDTTQNISSILPSLTNLRHFRIINGYSSDDKLLNSLPTSTLQTLSIPKLPPNLNFKHYFASLIGFHVKSSTVKDICYFFEYSPNLQYVTIRYIDRNRDEILDESLLTMNPVLQLKRLTIGSFGDNFFFLEKLLKRTSTLQTLSIPKLPSNLNLKHSFTSLIGLRVKSSNVEDLCHFFEYSPNLQYVAVRCIYTNSDEIFNDSFLTMNPVPRLKRLIIDDFVDNFLFLQKLLKRTPNLTHLTIAAHYNTDVIDAASWQQLITTSLPHLDVFRFKFRAFEEEIGDINNTFQAFQSDFWHHQHHWHTEYTLLEEEARIFTLPYTEDAYAITPYTKRCCDIPIDNMNTFTNVTDLTLHVQAMTDAYEYYFPNVKSLRLTNSRHNDLNTYPLLKARHIQYLKTIVDLSKVTHLDIVEECRFKSSSLLLQLVQETPNLSSLKINKNTLFSLMNNRKLCKYFNKLIKNLDIRDTIARRVSSSDEIMIVCQTFSNIEQFNCNVGPPHDLKSTLMVLSMFSQLKSFSYKTPYYRSGRSWLRKNKFKIASYSYDITCEGGYDYAYDNDLHCFYSYYSSSDYDSDW